MKLIPLIICIVMGVLIGVGLFVAWPQYAVQMTIGGMMLSTAIIGGVVVHLVDKQTE